MKTIITIGRQFGSGGRAIGQLVANKLGVKCYDRSLIDLTAKASGYNKKTLEKLDEKSSRKLFVAIPIGHYTNIGNAVFQYTMNDKIFFIQSDIIKQIAERESAVIVGRCANYVLSDREDTLNVYIYSELDERVKAVAERHYIDEKSAAQLVAKTDRKRASYYKFYTGSKWGTTTDYDLMLDSSLGYEKIADIIIEAAK